VDILDIASKLGVPFAILCFLGWAGIRLGKWIGEHVAKPVTAAHLRMIDTLETTAKSNATSQERMSEAVEKIGEAMEKQAGDITVIRQRVEEDR
jgi:hypothetical protein